VPLQFYINIMRIIPDSEMTAQYEITGGGGGAVGLLQQKQLSVLC
jgi:hypothetical protein